MAEINVVSDIHKIDSDVNSVYSFLSDFNKIGNMLTIAKQMGGDDRLKEFSEKVEEISFTGDTCLLKIKDAGELRINMLEKEEPKLIKLGTDEALPVGFTLWIQLVENGPYDTRMRLTLHADMNFMMKMMLKGKVEKGINKLCEGLARIPYMMLSRLG